VIRRQLVYEDRLQSFRVVISDEAVEHMFLLCDEDRSRETGGILIGSYSSDCTTAHVGEATSPPSDSKSGPNWFHRGTEGLEELLRERWHAEPRTYYVGEWHFHTAAVPWPSPQDKKQMRVVARDGRYDCARPLLIIVSPVGKGRWRVKCFIFPGGTSPEEVRMIDDQTLEEREPVDDAVS
jgi:hypothetical protein